MTAALTGASGPMMSAVTHAAAGTITTYLNGTPARDRGRPRGRHASGSACASARAATPRSRCQPTCTSSIVIDRAVSTSERERDRGLPRAQVGRRGRPAGGAPVQELRRPCARSRCPRSTPRFAAHVQLLRREPMSRPSATAGTAYNTSDTAVTAGISRPSTATGTCAARPRPGWHQRARLVGQAARTPTAPTSVARSTSPTSTATTTPAARPNLGDVVGLSLKHQRRDQRGARRRLSGLDDGLQLGRQRARRDLPASPRPRTGRCRASAPSATGWSPVVGLFDGSGRLPARRDREPEAPPVKLGFVPSNYDHSALTYTARTST